MMRDGLIAEAGDIVTCEKGHKLYRMAVDVPRYSPMKAAQFICLTEQAQAPVAGEKVRPCVCGADWFQLESNDMGFPTGRSRVHFEEGWRP